MAISEDSKEKMEETKMKWLTVVISFEFKKACPITKIHEITAVHQKKLSALLGIGICNSWDKI